MAFVHLHVHTEYSLLDGACRLEPLILAAKEQGQTALAITDHGVMYGAVDFYKLAQKHGIKPILGCEVYVAPRGRKDKVHELDAQYHHLVLLAQNQLGYQNLIKMVSMAWTEGFYTKPRIDHELLEQYHEGIIALSACLAGEVPRALLQGDLEKAKETALWYNEIFGQGNYFLELQDHGLKEQIRLNEQLIRISRETGIPLAATNDVHYVRKEDNRIQRVLICIQTNHTLEESTGLDFETEEFYLKDEDEMRALFSRVPEALENTQRIADRCQVDFEFGKTKLPYFDVPGEPDHGAYFRRRCRDGFTARYGESPPEGYRERLDYELDTIEKMGYTDYFLIVSDFIDFARSRHIPVGPGRGSGAGSIAAYCIGITGIDPMKYQLLFERFLNPERVSMPDFDIDFCYERRGEVIDYVIEKYGADHVAQIVTFGTLAARAAIRDVGRALGLPYATVDSVAKLVPPTLHVTLKEALKKSPDLRRQMESSEPIRDLIETAQKVEGMPRHASTHAAGVVITREPVSAYVPLAKNDDAVVTQFTMTALEELGLLKMDFLGLRTLTVIDDCRKMVQKSRTEFSIEKIPLDDPASFELFGKGQTDGIFQFESQGMKQVLMELKPESIEDLIAVVSLYRPGPANQISTFIENRRHPEHIQYAAPLLEDILDVTYGCMVYQEQVMQIFRKLAGYSYGRADVVRRAMSKKKHDVMERERQVFIHGLAGEDGVVECDGAVRRGVPEPTANAIFDEMAHFASYAFNKSHAAAYAHVAYQTAYLKCHEPCPFMAALLTSVLDSTNKIALYIRECKRLGMVVCPPHVNRSSAGFLGKDNQIFVGLSAIKNLGRNFIAQIVSQREAGDYADLDDFCKRLYGKDFNRRGMESLIRAGALDGLGANRRQMLQALPSILSELESSKRRNVDGQLGFFDLGEAPAQPRFQYPAVPEFPRRELLKMEKEMTGLYLSGHPMEEYEEVFQLSGAVRTSDLLMAGESEEKYRDNDKVSLFGMIGKLTLKTTKNDSTMAFLQIEDLYGSLEVIVFPKVLMEFAPLLREDELIQLDGRLSLKEEEEPKVICDRVRPAETSKAAYFGRTSENDVRQKAKRKGLFLRFPSLECPQLKKAQVILSIFDGAQPLYFYFEDQKKYILQPPACRVDVNEPMLQELRSILGDENVVFIQ